MPNALHKCALLTLLAIGVTSGTGGTGATMAYAASPYGLGKPIDDDRLSEWNIDVSPDGRGLPAGSGNVSHGRAVFSAKCAMCHGAVGQGGVGDPLVGGGGTLASTKPVKTVGSYWPYATTLFDYIRRAMPYDHPESLSAEEVYAVTAFVLNLNGIVPENARLDAHNLPKVRMPNRNGFVTDQKPIQR